MKILFVFVAYEFAKGLKNAMPLNIIYMFL